MGARAASVSLDPSQRIKLSAKGVRVPLDDRPLSIEMGQEVLHVYPEQPLDPASGERLGLMMVSPKRYLNGISHMIRIDPGDTLRVGDGSDDHRLLFDNPREALRRNLIITHDGSDLVFRDRMTEHGTFLSVLDEPDQRRIVDRRREALSSLIEIYGGPIEPLAPDEALATIREVNERRSDAAFRPLDSGGEPGALLELPDSVTPILVGDLHGNVDNLLKLLSVNSFLASLEDGSAAMVILGDAVHCDVPGRFEEMDPSVLTMDLIFRLMLRFPQSVFFVLGNHDSFSRSVRKGGVAQGLLWREHLDGVRGADYVEEMERFYDGAPVIARSSDFIACHAGPPPSQVTLQSLVDARHSPALLKALMTGRLRAPGYPTGYGASDVARLRKALGGDAHTPLLVGHMPRSDDRTVWLNVGKIKGHHVVYSAMPYFVGVFTRVDGNMIALTYDAEPIRGWLNEECKLA